MAQTDATPGAGFGLTVYLQAGLLAVAVPGIGLYVLNPSDGSVQWHATFQGDIYILGATSSNLYVGSAEEEGNSTLTSFKRSDGSQSWTYNEMGLEAGIAALG